MREFEIVNTFKETGQKQVYLAHHQEYGKVIIKIGKSPSQARLNRAKREVEIQRSLDSHYYPKNYDFKTSDDFRFIILEEFIESKPLSDSHQNFSEPLSILRLLKSLVQGLDLLWQAGVIHRDLKPDNILIRDDGSPVIIDLGIVLAIERSDLTPPFALFSPCTPAYAAPEQLKNRRAEIDHRTDQFILGIDVMELVLNGSHPFDPNVVGCGHAIEENIVNGAWAYERLDSQNFTQMRSLVKKMLSREPYQRYRSAEMILKEIDHCIEVYK